MANVVPARKLDDANIPKLREFMKAAKGGNLFHDGYGHGSDAHFDRQRDCIDQLPMLRSKLLHEGRTAVPEGAALDAALTALNAMTGCSKEPHPPDPLAGTTDATKAKD